MFPRHKVTFLNSLWFFAYVTSSLASAASYAADVDINANVGSEYTTNAGRTSNDEMAELVYQPGISVSAQHTGPRASLSADYRFTHRRYKRNTFDDENTTTGRGKLYFNVLPGRLDFTATNSRTETPIRAQDAGSPDNLQETANTQAGPILRFRTWGKDELQLQYLLGHRNSERTDNDSRSNTAIVRYIQTVSANNTFKYELISQSIEFDNVTAPDLNSNITQVTWDRKQDTLNWSFTAGFKNTKRNQNRGNVEGFIADLKLIVQIGNKTLLAVEASQDFRDQSEVLGFGSTEFGQTLRADSDLNEVFRSKRYYIGLQQTLGHTQFSAGFITVDEDYTDVLRDSTTLGVVLGAHRKLDRLSSITARLQYLTQDYTQQDIEFDQLLGSILYSRRLNRRLSVSAGLAYNGRDTDDVGLVNFDYDEWLSTIRFDYKLVD